MAEQTAPAPQPELQRTRTFLPDRAANALWAGLFFAPVALARWLEPSVAGVGTHEQLGLPPCTFLAITGFPCPFCGMTTSWSFAARFDLLHAVVTQPMGVVFFLVSLVMAVVIGVRAVTGAARFKLDAFIVRIPTLGWLGGLTLLFASWVYKCGRVRGWI